MIGFVVSLVDMTSQVETNENAAALVLRAEEDCCCFTGWGADTAVGRSNARLHWQVQLALPRLEIGLVGSEIKLAWPTNAVGFSLEANTNHFPTDDWSPVTNTPVLVGNQHVVTNMIGSEKIFYRLRKP